ncbi:MAG: hypothetical protein JWP58_286 [Hymenobacter sp.]|nr:hypothetical protein [Hymenobacter sp.]
MASAPYFVYDFSLRFLVFFQPLPVGILVAVLARQLVQQPESAVQICPAVGGGGRDGPAGLFPGKASGAFAPGFC